MKYIKAEWRGRLLSWFYSGRYWYVTQINRGTGDRIARRHPIGSGDSRDDAFIDYINQLEAIT